MRVVHSALRALACLHNIRSSALSGTAELEAGQEAAYGVDELVGDLLNPSTSTRMRGLYPTGLPALHRVHREFGSSRG